MFYFFHCFQHRISRSEAFNVWIVAVLFGGKAGLKALILLIYSHCSYFFCLWPFPMDWQIICLFSQRFQTFSNHLIFSSFMSRQSVCSIYIISFFLFFYISGWTSMDKVYTGIPSGQKDDQQEIGLGRHSPAATTAGQYSQGKKQVLS